MMMLQLAVWLSAVMGFRTSTCWREEKKVNSPILSWKVQRHSVLTKIKDASLKTSSPVYSEEGERLWRSDMKSKRCLGNSEFHVLPARWCVDKTRLQAREKSRNLCEQKSSRNLSSRQKEAAKRLKVSWIWLSAIFWNKGHFLRLPLSLLGKRRCCSLFLILLYIVICI